MRRSLTQDECIRAFFASDSAYEGIITVAVRTTGIFCRVTCRVKKPRVENVEFFPTTGDALHAGYRPCLRCKPLNTVSEIPEHANQLKAMVDRDPTIRIRERDLIDLGIDPSTARRQFQKSFGMTFHAYQRSRRMGSALATVRKGSSMMTTQVSHQFESSSGFRDAFAKLFGVSPSKHTSVKILSAKWLDSPLGPMLAIADDRGLLILDWVDRRGIERAIETLRRREQAAIVPQPHAIIDSIERELAKYFEGALQKFTTPLAAIGTPFQQSVWNELLKIAPGQTRSYRDQAMAIGNVAAVRAVARANGENYRSIIIPCHRVIGSDGSLTGYGGGLARKQWLLEQERRYSTRGLS